MNTIIELDAASRIVKDISPYIDFDNLMASAMKLIIAPCPKCTQSWMPFAVDCGCGYKFLPSSNLLLNGPYGVGKSLMAANIAQDLSEQLDVDVPMVTVDCSEGTMEYHLKGMNIGVGAGETPFVLGPLPGAIDLANKVGVCILNAEEINALTPGAQAVFNALTDWREGIEVPQVSKRYSLNPGCRLIILASMNDSVFGGVFSLNADLRSRFDELRVDYPGAEDERKILMALCPYAEGAFVEKAIQLAKESRTETFDTSLSTRDLVKLLQNTRKLGAAEMSLQMIANKFEASERSTIADRIKALFRVAVK